SYFQSQATESTDFSVAVQQRLFGKLNLGLSGGYRTVDYVATSTSISVNRADDYVYIGVNLSFPFLTHGTISGYYQYSDNASSQSGYSFSSSQIGLSVGYRL